jgi:hypothetical protein
MKKVLIIGNSEPAANHACLLEEAEVVVRFNNKQYKIMPDHIKTTCLSIVNTGAVGHALLQDIRSNAFYSKAHTILFARSQRTHQNHLLHNPLRDQYPKEEAMDVSQWYEEEIVRDGKEVVRLSDELNQSCFRLIQSRTHRPFICPSSGFLVVWSFLNDARYKGYEKHVVGFSFKGWWGHPWEAEKEIMSELHRNNQLILHHCTLMDKAVYKARRLGQKIFR